MELLSSVPSISKKEMQQTLLQKLEMWKPIEQYICNMNELWCQVWDEF